MTRFFRVLIICFVAGCGASQAPEATTPDSPMLVGIQEIVAEQLELTAAEVDPDLTFAAIGADDLDIVEITMEAETKFDIAIPDEALVHAARSTNANSLCDDLTIRAFARVAEKASKQPRRERLPVADDGALRESQVGAFGELSKLPNPNGFVLVFVPSFENVVQIHEQRLGHKLDNAEMEALRQKAAVVSLPREMADNLKEQKSLWGRSNENR